MNIEAHPTADALWIHVGGEADLSNHEQLRRALSQVELDGSDDVRLGLADLTFCDVHAFRGILDFAAHTRRNGHDISIHHANRLVRRMTEIFGVGHELTFA